MFVQLFWHYKQNVLPKAVSAIPGTGHSFPQSQESQNLLKDTLHPMIKWGNWRPQPELCHSYDVLILTGNLKVTDEHNVTAPDSDAAKLK